MTLSGIDIQRIHASFGTVEELSRRRRAIYQLALDATAYRPAACDGSSGLRPAVLDNPVVRAHLGAVMGGAVDFDPEHVRPIDDFAASVTWDGAPGSDLRLAARRSAAPALSPALTRIGAGLGQVDLGADPTTLILADSRSFGAVRRRILDGVRLALDIAPDLVTDLLPHVALLAVVRADIAGRLGSASLREFPGLIVLPEPQTALEVAEAIVHEGAHVKFFDLAMTCSLLAPGDTDRFSPPWAPEGAAAWQFEQVVAAFHAYCCLAAFYDALCHRYLFELHAHSLLPLAEERTRVIGRFLLDHGGALGADGQSFVSRLAGSDFTVPAAGADASDLLRRATLADPSVKSSDCGRWTLLMRWTKPVSLAWVRSSYLA